MRIHGNSITRTQLGEAAALAGVTFVRRHWHESRSRDHAFEVILSGNSPYRCMGGDRDEYAASWDQWGIFLNKIFDLDPSITIPRVYADAALFHKITGDRFRTLRLADAHRRHRWQAPGNCTASCACGAFRCWGWGI
jgi:hypothetical protein